jgi:hypothetical protein
LIFIFDSPVADEISSLPVLEDYLNNAQIEAQHAFAKRLLNNELYVITAVLKIKKFAVAVMDSSQADAQLQVPVLESLLKGGVEASATQQLTQLYHYEDCFCDSSGESASNPVALGIDLGTERRFFHLSQ